MQVRQVLIGACVMLVGVVSAEAQLKSGPAAESEVAGFKVHAVTGEFADKDVDYLQERKDKTTIFLFIAADKFDRPIARYFKTLDKSVTDAVEGTAGVEVVAIWLTDDVAKSREYLPKAQQSLKFEHTALAVFPGATQGPGGWGIDTEAHLTTVIVKGKKVIASFGYRSTNETDVREVVSALKPKA